MNLLKPYLIFFSIVLLFNCVFHIAYLQNAASVSAWFTAMRFAAATVAAALMVPGLIYLIMPWRIGRRIALWLAGLVIYYCLTVLIGDIAYYRQAGKHSTIELMLFYQNFTDISLMALRDYTYIPIAYTAIGAMFFWLWSKLVRSEEKNAPRRANLSWKTLVQKVAQVGVFCIASIIAFRGGLQGRPLRPADAFQNLTQAEGDFALNGVYTSFYAISHRSTFPARADAESIQAVQKLIGTPSEKFLSSELPFYRIRQSTGPAIRKNVVFIILESWSAKRLGIFGDKTGATPFFDSLAQKGWLLTQAFATGRRSIASLPSAISSIPTLYGSLYITSPHEQNFQRGMGSLFAAEGYTTSFTYAAKAGSMGFNAFARLAGFEKIITRENFAASAAHDGTWGVYDHVMLARALNDIDAAKKPALSVLYTLHPHPPFTLPPGNDFFTADKPRAQYYNALKYSDSTLRDFFSAAEQKPWFKDTVFVLMADHAFEDAQGYDAFHIPLLFYSPGFIAAKSDKTVASELDVLPTLLDILHLPVAHAAMGKSLLAEGTHFAFIDVEHTAGVIRQKQDSLLALLYDPEKYRGYFDMSIDPMWKSQIAQAPFADAEMHAMRQYIDAMGFAVAKNRIAPRSTR